MVDRYLEKIEDGANLTIACSQYEQYYWYSDGEYHTAMENGLYDPKEKVVSEDTVRSDITQALMSPERYDIFFEEEYSEEDLDDDE